jgi:hypothetical protein
MSDDEPVTLSARPLPPVGRLPQAAELMTWQSPGQGAQPPDRMMNLSLYPPAPSRP